MVTHGYVVFKYQGIYYIYNNHSDSYCEHLGNLVVNEIYDMINNNYIEHYKKNLLRVPLWNQMTEGGGGISHFYSFYSAIYDPDSCSYYTATYEPSNEYVYIIDFDEEEFIVDSNNRCTFNLFDIPENWMKFVNTNEGDYMYNKTKEITNEKVQAKISALEEEINQLKLKLV